VVEGESPGSMFELSISDSFYLGGLPRIVNARFTVQSFRGCIRNVKLDVDNYVDLTKAKSSKGVQQSCLNREVRVVSLLSERSHAAVRNLSVDRQLELAFRFRTAQTSAHIVTVSVGNDDNEIVSVSLVDSQLVVSPSKGPEEGSGTIRVELSTRLAGDWHYVSVQRTKNSLKAHVDDVYSKELEAYYDGELISSDVALAFGRDAEAGQHLVGCIGDVIVNGKLLDLAKSAHNELRLTGCSIAGATFTASSGEKGVGLPTDSSDNAAASPPTPTEAVTIAYQPSVSHVRPEGSCALPDVSHGEREDSTGIRFGLSPGSRLEFDRPPDSFDRNMVFSIQLRATAANGIIMFVTNEKHSDFMALYLDSGRIVFSYGNGAARV